MITPSGRFQPNTRLCLSISDFHPKTWDPTWGVSTILTGLLSFMTSNELTTGALISSDEEKIKLAKLSKEWNLSNRKFLEEFPKEAAENREQILHKKTAERQVAAATAAAVRESASRPASNNLAIGVDNNAAASQRKAPLGVYNAAAVGTARDSKHSTSINRNGDGGGGTNWIKTHKFMCLCVVVLSYVVFSRVSTSINTRP